MTVVTVHFKNMNVLCYTEGGAVHQAVLLPLFMIQEKHLRLFSMLNVS